MTTLRARLIRKIAKVKARQTRGGSWVQFIVNIGSFAAIFKLLFEGSGVSIEMTLLIGAALYFGSTYVLGYIDENYGVWEHENAYNASMNPSTIRILNNISDGDGTDFIDRVRKRV